MIPPLERIFNLVGADVKSWYREMSKSKRVHRGAATKAGTKPVMLEEHFVSDRCIACHAPGGNGGTAQILWPSGETESDSCALRDMQVSAPHASPDRPRRSINSSRANTPSSLDNTPSTRFASLARQTLSTNPSLAIRSTAPTTTLAFATITSSPRSSSCPPCLSDDVHACRCNIYA